MKNEARFWARVDAEDAAACWRWLGARNRNGYGRVGERRPGQTRLAHRIAYELCVGPIPFGLTLDHLCRNTGCVNPFHLEPVTQIENLARGEGIAAKNERKTHCDNGHELTESNTYHRPGFPTHRQCNTCRDGHTRRWNMALSERRAAARAAP